MGYVLCIMEKNPNYYLLYMYFIGRSIFVTFTARFNWSALLCMSVLPVEDFMNQLLLLGTTIVIYSLLFINNKK